MARRAPFRECSRCERRVCRRGCGRPVSEVTDHPAHLRPQRDRTDGALAALIFAIARPMRSRLSAPVTAHDGRELEASRGLASRVGHMGGSRLGGSSATSVQPEPRGDGGRGYYSGSPTFGCRRVADQRSGNRPVASRLLVDNPSASGPPTATTVTASCSPRADFARASS